MKKLLVKQVKSSIGCHRKQWLYLRALGLKKIGHTVERLDNQINRRLIKKAHHLVRVIGERVQK